LPEKIPARIYNAESLNIPTTCWDKKQIKNGYKNQLVGKHSEAMPRWLVDEMIDIFVPSNGKVLDLFGGAGTVLVKCRSKGIPCISTEIKEENCSLILKRLYLE
jgi:DNA modification methylase